MQFSKQTNKQKTATLIFKNIFAKTFYTTACFVVGAHLARQHAQSCMDVFSVMAFLFADLASRYRLMVLGCL